MSAAQAMPSFGSPLANNSPHSQGYGCLGLRNQETIKESVISGNITYLESGQYIDQGTLHMQSGSEAEMDEDESPQSRQHPMSHNMFNRNSKNKLLGIPMGLNQNFKSDNENSEPENRGNNTLDPNPKNFREQGKLMGRRGQRKKSVISSIIPFLDDGIKFGESVDVVAKTKAPRRKDRTYSNNLRNLFAEPSEFKERVNFGPTNLARKASDDNQIGLESVDKQETKVSNKKKRYSLGIHQIHQARPPIGRKSNKKLSTFSRHQPPVSPTLEDAKKTSGSDANSSQSKKTEDFEPVIRTDDKKGTRRTDKRMTHQTHDLDGKRSEHNRFEDCNSDQFSNDSDFFEDTPVNVVNWKGKEIDIGLNTMVTSFRDRMNANAETKKLQRHITIDFLKKKKTVVESDSSGEDFNANIIMKKRHS